MIYTFCFSIFEGGTLAQLLSNQASPAILVLADGTVFRGFGLGAEQAVVGEVVFNTAMTGYQEVLTDPSYYHQMVTMTYPHIGNVGINPQDKESARVGASALIMREISPVVSNWRADQSLSEFLTAHGVTAITGVDTRRLTRHLRDSGAQSGCIMKGDQVESALEKARQFKGTVGLDCAQEVTCQETYEWSEGSDHVCALNPAKRLDAHVVVYDFGVKQQILRLLVDRGCRVTVVPAKTSVEQVLALQPDGVFLSNGPGDPSACDYAIANTKALLQRGVPLFGICLGFQIMALACGARTVKMKFGHHGANHPVQNMQTSRVAITSQNHSYCVDMDTLPPELCPTHVSLFDGTLQGIRHRDCPAMAFQGHPEASPGPQDIYELFDDFIEMIAVRKKPLCQKEPI
jgi:carbamoyl-phosphate synthase small subunit